MIIMNNSLLVVSPLIVRPTHAILSLPVYAYFLGDR